MRKGEKKEKLDKRAREKNKIGVIDGKTEREKHKPKQMEDKEGGEEEEEEEEI